MTQIKQSETGFALLITLLMLAVVIAVTLSLVQLSLKQLKLAVDGRDAEIAFQAASAGVECLRRVSIMASSTIQVGGLITGQSCFGASFPVPTHLLLNPSVSQYSGLAKANNGISWGPTGARRCTEFELIVINAEVDSITLPEDTIKGIIANYTGGDLVCESGGVCHILAVGGYNAACDQISNPGVLKREFLLQF